MIVHAQHGQCQKINREHVKDLTLAMYIRQDLEPVDCLPKDSAGMSCTFRLGQTSNMEVSSLICVTPLGVCCQSTPAWRTLKL